MKRVLASLLFAFLMLAALCAQQPTAEQLKTAKVGLIE